MCVVGELQGMWGMKSGTFEECRDVSSFNINLTKYVREIVKNTVK